MPARFAAPVSGSVRACDSNSRLSTFSRPVELLQLALARAALLHLAAQTPDAAQQVSRITTSQSTIRPEVEAVRSRAAADELEAADLETVHGPARRPSRSAPREARRCRTPASTARAGSVARAATSWRPGSRRARSTAGYASSRVWTSTWLNFSVLVSPARLYAGFQLRRNTRTVWRRPGSAARGAGACRPSGRSRRVDLVGAERVLEAWPDLALPALRARSVQRATLLPPASASPLTSAANRVTGVDDQAALEQPGAGRARRRR